jgi:hypothetical protein
MDGGTNRALIDVVRSCASDLTALLDVSLDGISRQGDVLEHQQTKARKERAYLHFSIKQLAKGQSQPCTRGTGRADQKHVLT